MAEVAKKRAMRVWSMNTGKREPLFDGVKIEEKWQSALESPTGISLRRGIPVLAVCLFAGQGKLSGGAMPFAPALLAGAMMCGRSVGYAAAGCAVGALLILLSSPMQALAFIVLFLVLQQVEGNLIYPKVVGSSIGLPGIWVLAAVTIGGGVGGLVGVLLSVPVASVLYALLRRDVHKRLACKE